MGQVAAAVYAVSRLEITHDTGHTPYSPCKKFEEISSNTNAFHKVYSSLHDEY